MGTIAVIPQFGNPSSGVSSHVRSQAAARRKGKSNRRSMGRLEGRRRVPFAFLNRHIKQSPPIGLPTFARTVRGYAQHVRVGSWPDPDTAVQLTTDELAMRLLRRMAEEGPPVGRSNLIGLYRERYYDIYSGGQRPTVHHRLWEQKVSEAFDWLIANGLLARDSSQRSDNWVVVSQLGQEMLAAPDSRRFYEAHKLLAITMHPRIEHRVRQQFFAGDLESAVFIAVKEVEVAVRDAAGLPKDMIGVKLMAAAFKPGEGPLHDPDIPTGEQAGVMALYSGLIGALKKP